MEKLTGKDFTTFYNMFRHYIEHHKEVCSMYDPNENVASKNLIKMHLEEMEDAVELFKKIIPPDYGLTEAMFVEIIEEIKRSL